VVLTDFAGEENPTKLNSSAVQETLLCGLKFKKSWCYQSHKQKKCTWKNIIILGNLLLNPPVLKCSLRNHQSIHDSERRHPHQTCHRTGRHQGRCSDFGNLGVEMNRIPLSLESSISSP